MSKRADDGDFDWIGSYPSGSLDEDAAAALASKFEEMRAPDIAQIIKIAQSSYEVVHERETDEVLRQVMQMLDDNGVELDEFFRRSEKSRTVEPVRFRNKKDPSMTWTGRGRLPRWLKKIKDDGGDIEDHRIAN